MSPTSYYQPSHVVSEQRLTDGSEPLILRTQPKGFVPGIVRRAQRRIVRVQVKDLADVLVELDGVVSIECRRFHSGQNRADLQVILDEGRGEARAFATSERRLSTP